MQQNHLVKHFSIGDIVLVQYKVSTSSKLLHGKIGKIIAEIQDYRLETRKAYHLNIEVPMINDKTYYAGGVWSDEILLLENLTDLEKILYDVD